ncbi:alpha/beta fold hydrolase [Ottowia thiooxydans]|uniref:alpha/beta fold hydrolase n=1 Tax=Ottowia thiooxydans TaxID=219182 RepID=UPI0003F8FFDA|nr:alpha/beta hydrolase [Ottowia thiooxydans]
MKTEAHTAEVAKPFRSVWSELRETSFRQGWIDAGGIRTRYVQAGPEDGPPLLMVHGTGGSWECFCANLAAFSKHYNCYAFDTIGSGFSGKPDIDYEIPVYVEHVRNFMQAVGIDKASIIGVSLGAWIAVRFALMHPEKTQSLMLISAAGLLTDAQTSTEIKGARYKAVDDPSWANVSAVFKGLILEEQNRIDDFVGVRQAVYQQPGMRRAMEHILCLQEPHMRARNLIAEDEWRSLQAPTLVIGAVDHKDIFLETAQRVSKLIPKAEYVEIRRSSHWSQFESPEDFNRAGLDFMQRTVS